MKSATRGPDSRVAFDIIIQSISNINTLQAAAFAASIFSLIH